MSPKQKQRYGVVKEEIARCADEVFKIAKTEGHGSVAGLTKIEELLALYKEKMLIRGMHPRVYHMRYPKDYAMVKFLEQALANKDNPKFKEHFKR